MKKQLDSLKRIDRVQRQLRELAVWRLASLARRLDASTQDHGEIVDAIGRDTAPYGPLGAALTRALRVAEQRVEISARDHLAQSKAALDAASRANLAERAMTGAGTRYKAQRERRELADLVEQSLSALKARFG